SRKRGAAVKALLAAENGCDAEALAAVHVPVGLDIGARTPGDVAIAIVAQIVAALPRVQVADEDETERSVATDPVCGMQVEIATAQHRVEHAGRTFFFCGAGCRASFAAEHERV
ncbi:MAG TPA: XdhC family protein, partial [Candidatus Elarobacter sp.]|nr:XdhC family protein [Candidatus Elarobacter sp.]